MDSASQRCVGGARDEDDCVKVVRSTESEILGLKELVVEATVVGDTRAVDGGRVPAVVDPEEMTRDEGVRTDVSVPNVVGGKVLGGSEDTRLPDSSDSSLPVSGVTVEVRKGEGVRTSGDSSVDCNGVGDNVERGGITGVGVAEEEYNVIGRGISSGSRSEMLDSDLIVGTRDGTL